MLRVLTAQESAQTNRARLVGAMRALAEAQQAIAVAIEALDSFEQNFRLGHYKAVEHEYGLALPPRPMPEEENPNA